uniref:Vint domain-containing protein n=1 Tax=viral metagenome TaxID=1070528 RepID=A0A6C0KIQ7_9ZZZZ
MDTFNTIYNKKGYFDKYGGSFFMTGLIISTFFIIYSYFHAKYQLNLLKHNWVEERCNPSVMPFAGLINAKPGTSKLDYTLDNFSNCSYTILKNITSDFLAPIHYAINVIVTIFKDIEDSIQKIRTMFTQIRDQITKVVLTIMYKVLNVLMPVRLLVMKMKDIFGKSNAIMTTALFTGLSGLYTIYTLFSVFFEIILIFLGIIAAITAALLFDPFTIVAGEALLAWWILIAVPFFIIAIVIKIYVASARGSSMPGIPGCFDKDTIIGNKKISDLNIGDKIDTKNHITGIFKIATENIKMYNYHGIIVSETHRIFDIKSLKWKMIKDVKDALLIINYYEPFIYCINTTKKKFNIGENVFLDWDDLDDNEVNFFINEYENIKSSQNINEQFCGGFTEDTLLELEDGKYTTIKDIEIHQKLKTGETILGKIELESSHYVKEYIIGDTCFSCSPHIQLNNIDLMNISTSHLSGIPIHNKKKIYNLITNTRFFTIGTIQFHDYDGCLNIPLKKYNKKFYFL